MANTPSEEWRFDTLIIDEAQDFEGEWFEAVRLFLRENAAMLWLEDPNQNVRGVDAVALQQQGFVGYRSLLNYRSPERIAQVINAVLQELPFTCANDLPGLGVGTSFYGEPADQPRLVGRIVGRLLKERFQAKDIAVLSCQGLDSTALKAAERAALLGIAGLPDRAVEADVRRRSRDWSQVRPEWALANNAAFIAAPRPRSAGMDLGGRAFLHEYVWEKDSGSQILELIMTAPMVVANWINMQYHGSVVDNRRFGSGNKVLHNVVGGAIGVLEGNGGDLRVGLPLQSLHDGKHWVHEPLRLSGFIEAPQAAMDDIIARHEPGAPAGGERLAPPVQHRRGQRCLPPPARRPMGAQ